MTTTVKITVTGNKACTVKAIGPGLDTSSATYRPQIARPGSDPVTVQIHGEQWVEVRETGDFIS